MGSQKEFDHQRISRDDPFRTLDGPGAASLFTGNTDTAAAFPQFYTMPATTPGKEQEAEAAETTAVIDPQTQAAAGNVPAQELSEKEIVVIPAFLLQPNGGTIRFQVGEPDGEASANYYEDVQYVMDKLLEVGLLSQAAHAAEYPADPQRTFGMYPVSHYIFQPSPYVDKALIPETIKAIHILQKDVIGWKGSDGNISPGKNTIARLDAATPESVAADKERVRARRAADAAAAAEAADKKAKEDARVKREQEQAAIEAARVQAIREEPKDTAYVKSLYEEYGDNLDNFGCYLVERAIHNPQLVENLLDEASDDWWNDDSLAAAIIINAEVDELKRINLGLLNSLARRLDEGPTFFEQQDALDKVRAAIEAQEDYIFSKDGPGSENEAGSEASKELSAELLPDIVDGKATYYRGALTVAAEGNDSQTSHVHWPETERSGVTMGKGYDMKLRKKHEIKKHLSDAGLEESKINAIINGRVVLNKGTDSEKTLVGAYGKKGAIAGEWVKQNKDKVGEIPKLVQYNLFKIVYDYYENEAERRSTTTTSNSRYTASGHAKRNNIEPETLVVSQEQWDSVSPMIKDVLADMVYRGSDYGEKRLALITPILKDESLSELEMLKKFKEIFSDPIIRDYVSDDFYKRRNNQRITHIDRYIRYLEAGYEIKYEDISYENRGEATKVNDYMKEYFAFKSPLGNGVGINQPNAEEDIKVIQELLIANGTESITIDGIYNDRLLEAIKNYQQSLVDNGDLRSVDGIIGKNGTTIKKLLRK